MLNFVLLVGLSLPLTADDKRLASVKRICIGTIAEIGLGEPGEFVRTAMRFELTKAGFTVVDAAANADATLNMTARSAWPNAWVLSLAVLKTPDGEDIWEKEFRNRGTRGTFSRAQSVAKTLRKDVALATKGR